MMWSTVIVALISALAALGGVVIQQLFEHRRTELALRDQLAVRRREDLLYWSEVRRDVYRRYLTTVARWEDFLYYPDLVSDDGDDIDTVYRTSGELLSEIGLVASDTVYHAAFRNFTLLANAPRPRSQKNTDKARRELLEVDEQLAQQLQQQSDTSPREVLQNETRTAWRYTSRLMRQDIGADVAGDKPAVG